MADFAEVNAPEGFDARLVALAGCDEPGCVACRAFPTGVTLAFLNPVDDPDRWLCLGPAALSTERVDVMEEARGPLHKLAILFGAPWEMVQERPSWIGRTQIEMLNDLEPAYLAWVQSTPVDEVRARDAALMDFVDGLEPGEMLRMSVLGEPNPLAGRN